MFASAPARRKSLKPSPLPSRARAMSTQVVDVSEFVPLRTLGQGSFGAVLLVRKRSAPNAGRAFAMKIMDKEKMIRRNITESARVEKEILRSARHPCLARLRYAFQSPARLFLVMDYYQGGSLEDRLRAEPGRAIAAAGATFAAGELALGLAHLHQLGVIHRDLKPANVLLDLGGHCAIADYGLAVALDTQADGAREPSARRVEINYATRLQFWSGVPNQWLISTQVGTLSYMAPEFLRKDATTYDERVDWWALGCIVFEMRCGHTPFERPFPKRTPPPAPRDLFANIVRADAPAVEGDGVATAFVGALLRKQAADRPRWKKIRRHAFFADVDFGKLERRELASPLARGAHSVDDDGDHSDDDDDARRAPPPASPGARSILEASGATDAAGTSPSARASSATQRLMSFFVAGDDAPGASRADLFAGFGYRASEDDVLEVAESPPDDAPASPRARWWNPFSRQRGAVDASDL
ncbi:serine/threonine kinase [Aureococcus anophagefferens]|nr:serine/threonine kinase [Aureococcus anophagefferens]